MKASLLAVMIGLMALAPGAIAADLIVGADVASGANKLFSFQTDGTSGNGVLDANYISLSGGAQGVTYDSVTQRIFATQGTNVIRAFQLDKSAVGSYTVTMPSNGWRNLRMNANVSAILAAENASGQVATLSPSNPSSVSTTYAQASVYSMYQPSIGGFVYAIDNSGNITRYDENGTNATPISLTGKATSTNYRDIYFIDPTTFFVSVRATASGNVGGVYKFTLSNTAATTATLDTAWGSSGKALVSNATGLAASSDGTWLYVSASFSSTSNMHSVKLSDGATNSLMTNITGVYNYITVVPEPSALILACLAGLGIFIRNHELTKHIFFFWF